MFESQYNEEMEVEVLRLEAKARAVLAGKPQWLNACASCGSELETVDVSRCSRCEASN
jgi:hypothetical protein